jgi:hypothetical protein
VPAGTFNVEAQQSGRRRLKVAGVFVAVRLAETALGPLVAEGRNQFREAADSPV